MRQLVLWDIDHTLIENSGASKAIYLSAYQDIVGRPPRALPITEGRTDRRIMHDLFDMSGVEQPQWAIVEQALAASGRAHLDVLREIGWVLPGATEAIHALTQVSGVEQGILTGNIRENALVKLAAFGIDKALDFDLGAYGADDDDRSRLVDIARQRVKVKTGYDFSGQSTVLIGDTPRDVKAARFSGARIIAVASGSYSMDDLVAAGAETVLPDLLDTGGLVAAVLDEHGTA